MGRLLKEGLDFFSLDTDFLQNKKVRKIKLACGPQSVSILICLLCNIYRDKGYYILWDKDLPFLIADEIGVSEGAVIETLIKALQVGFFSQEIYDSQKVLTSEEIQKRYSKVCIDSKRKGWDLNPAFIPDSGKTPEEMRFTPEEIPKTQEESTQSRVEKSKVEKKRVGIPPAEPDAHTPDQKKLFSAFSDWIERHAPRVNKMKEPITIDQFITIRQKMTNLIVTELLLQMHNWEPLLKKNRSAYLTLSNWYSRRDEVKRPLQKDELDDYKAKREKELERAKQINEGNI